MWRQLILGIFMIYVIKHAMIILKLKNTFKVLYALCLSKLGCKYIFRYKNRTQFLPSLTSHLFDSIIHFIIASFVVSNFKYLISYTHAVQCIYFPPYSSAHCYKQ